MQKPLPPTANTVYESIQINNLAYNFSQNVRFFYDFPNDMMRLDWMDPSGAEQSNVYDVRNVRDLRVLMDGKGKG